MGEDLKLFLGEVMIDVDEDQAAKYQEKFMEEKKNEMDELGKNHCYSTTCILCIAGILEFA
jgi:CheY-specific phosphatase CheX